ncbi:MAG: hypothetical protein PHU26_06550 [Methanofollis liminatans]|uniref:Uncharacterized protein n=1 Tax=Methanofollis liminatans DSM 4140 TaxID=28892 RepID=J0S8Y4_9EURY|nr:hypothetical protein [Methanofollis liminatans]EJG07064.1 hypothetical protein Metli_1107 [Methanofollis liminatans DSM 4140]MDD3111936.1 hypothetical protein [Methanofollis liminatans]
MAVATDDLSFFSTGGPVLTRTELLSFQRTQSRPGGKNERRGLDPYFAEDKNKETIHPSRGGKIPKFVMISNCGFPEQSHFQVLHLLTERMARNYKTEFVAEIYRGGGAWLKEPSLDEEVARYRDPVKLAGEEVVTQGRLSGETKAHLELPLIPSPDYIEIYRTTVNRYWDGVLGGRT